MSPQVRPIAADDSRLADPLLEDLVDFVGYRPNALLTMARMDELLPAILNLVRITLRGEGAVPPRLRLLIACEASRSGGCFYSAVHAAHAALHLDIPVEKLAALGEFERDPAFEPHERAALAIARAGGTLPVRKPAAAFEEARKHFSDDQIVAIVAAVAAFGWFNRWNSLMNSELEEAPAAIIADMPWLQHMQHAKERSGCGG
ncbi:carboxymuconolactone decarboxylase family protein [bacterium]|nr:carboxymuconolactone decarboxylase family protein [bacterium]